MSLTKEKIQKNFKRYFETGENYGFMTEELMKFLSPDIVGAPASSQKDIHNAFEGGLVDHMLRVTKYAVVLNDSLPENMQVDKKSLVKVCCLHQIGKVHLYVPTDEKWKNDRGIYYEFNNKLTSMKVGERSAYYAMSHGVTLTDEEYQAIINYDKDDSDKQAKWHTSTLGNLLKMAGQMAVMVEKGRDE